ncbi:type IV secretory system conjugative DNA transfer family protein [Rhodococcus sp. BP-349]|uniref:type IV secretory system conjugative DNA transfer family protein n=1 Tax=unclassified Rhodococcus (in: high G+C Gram-positive bacteria) TaxID=192944 RepID=UPI001C9AC9EC|nr:MULTISPECIES: TraM recognition domain-containing protein [unclassified Rhodococcus (in: high G+C Gram-positive bacteria)]MBY6537659.1 type IV secretory system conjugative DNA transfer family protein [Rhodococcus sp. BP-363]MBY6541996.1 type IV secretory system conjugative DNA transfer family protein [Rhodococcus sp. BP-369]MBY6561226.1 type IV secretory system conjugative DNA transfer family protein [Rhodococcus sp. BP-370]MBY6575518.1 type IV secretory system conjugative DNA transfer family
MTRRKDGVIVRDLYRNEIWATVALWLFGLFVIAAVLVTVAAVWGSALAGGDGEVSYNPFATIPALLSGEVVWHPASTVIAVALAAVLVIAAGFAVRVAARRRSRAPMPTPEGLATKTDLHRSGMTEKSVRLRGQENSARYEHTATLAGAAAFTKDGAATRRRGSGRDDTAVPSTRYGALLGLEHASGVPVWVQHADSHLIEGPAQAGKTSQIVVPNALPAPGALVLSSTKAEIVYLTWLPRSRQGTIAVFDPENISQWPGRIKFSAVAGCEDPDVAIRRAVALVSARPMEGATGADFFEGRAKTMLRCYLHAAALADLGLTAVARWCSSKAPEEALRILSEHRPDWAEALSGILDSRADKTTDTIVQVLSSIMEPLASPALLAAVDCPAEESFDVAEFVRTNTGTLYLLSEGGNESVAPFVALLAAEVFKVASDYSQTLPARRIDPPLKMLLDEVNNVAPIPELPEKMSDSGGRGISLWCFTHNRSQTEKRWGREGAALFVGSANTRIVLPGLLDTNALREISTLIGQREELVLNAPDKKRDGGMTQQRQGSLVVRPIMTESAIREMPDKTALVIRRNSKAVMVTLLGYYEDPAIAEIVAESEQWALRSVAAGRVLTPTSADGVVVDEEYGQEARL